MAYYMQVGEGTAKQLVGYMREWAAEARKEGNEVRALRWEKSADIHEAKHVK